jgi:hypothetical protein
MSKPKQKKSGSKSKHRVPARKVKPKCGQCRKGLRTYAEIELGYCQDCLTRPRTLDPENTLLRELRMKGGA